MATLYNCQKLVYDKNGPPWIPWQQRLWSVKSLCGLFCKAFKSNWSKCNVRPTTQGWDRTEWIYADQSESLPFFWTRNPRSCSITSFKAAISSGYTETMTLVSWSTTKPKKWCVRLAKTQISLHIRQLILWSDCADVHADLSLCWSRLPLHLFVMLWLTLFFPIKTS